MASEKLRSQLLSISESFHSIQGEGHHAGRSTFFLRTQGCSVGCTWCDTKYSWSKSKGSFFEIDSLYGEALSAIRSGAEIIVITGGEPLEQNLEGLCSTFSSLSTPIHIETSGTQPLSGSFDWITLSPKRHKLPLDEILGLCHELKVIITGPGDLEFAESMRAEVARCKPNSSSNRTLFYLQPEWNNPVALTECVHFVKAHSPWRLSLQTHKMIDIP